MGIVGCKSTRSGPFFTVFFTHSGGFGPANPAKTVLAGADFRFRRPKSDRLLENRMNTILTISSFVAIFFSCKPFVERYSPGNWSLVDPSH